MASEVDVDLMGRAIANAARSRFITAPNPWVGAVVAARDGSLFDGATRPPGGPHAERVALDAAGPHAAGATVYSTLEPCGHSGRTGPCTDALIEAEVARVVIGIADPDPQVAGSGVARLRSAGVEVEVGVRPGEVEAQLAPYLHHRRTGRPLVVLKMASSLDGRTAAADGSSRWITGAEARAVVHRLRAESDAILVGAGTVRADDPSLTVRDWEPADDVERGADGLDPRRVVLGVAATGANVHPCTELSGPLPAVLDQLGAEGVMQLMVEGGAHVAAQFHADGLVDRYELFLAPALFGGDDGRPLFAGQGAPTMADVWRGRIIGVERAGDDLHVTLVPAAR
ncbi:MAG: bifunctional diaminohydroxyphosphoribosylaminopyrimidine deaminase/5-amino-6-(5-phosphoribosylamino)uracil reductase RibD [Actinomycetota bacterium]